MLGLQARGSGFPGKKKEDAFRHSGAEPVLRASHPQLRTDASEHTEGWETRQMDVAAGGTWPQCATSVKGCLVISKQLPDNRKETTERRGGLAAM